MPDSLQDALDAKRPNYDEEGTWQRFLLEAFLGCGGFQGRVKQPPSGFWGSAAEAYSGFSVISLLSSKSLRSEKSTYLDRHIREDAEKFERRVQVAHYLNYVRPTTELKVSYLVRKPLIRNHVPDELQAWIQRSGYDLGFRRRALLAFVLGWFHLRVDRPSTDPGAITQAQAGDSDPFIVIELPCNVLDYETDAGDQLLWAKYVSTFTRRPAFDKPRVTVTRHTVWTRSGFEVYESEEVDGANRSAPRKVQEGMHSHGRVPVVSWRSSTSLEDPVKAESLTSDISVEARRLFNVCSEYDEHMRGQVFAVLVWPRSTAPAEGEKSAEVGVENGLIIDPNQKNMPGFIAPPAEIAKTFETRIEKSIIEIYRMARVEYDRASGTRSSAQSKEQNFEQTNLSIADFAAAMAQADLETLKLVGAALKISPAKLEKMTVEAHASYATEELNEEIDAINQTMTLSMGLTYKVELLRRLASRMLPNLSADAKQKIESEIEEAAKAAEEAAEQAKAALAQEPPDPDGEGNDDAPAAGGGGDENQDDDPQRAAA